MSPSLGLAPRPLLPRPPAEFCQQVGGTDRGERSPALGSGKKAHVGWAIVIKSNLIPNLIQTSKFEMNLIILE
jgi:hypothetical protein